MLLNEEIAKHLDIPAEDVNNALEDLFSTINQSLTDGQPAEVPGIGLFEKVDGAISFKPAETLSLAVNTRYAALDSEMIQLGFEEPEFLLSETMDEGNEQEVDQSLIDHIIADDMASQDLFLDKDNTETFSVPIDLSNPFDGELLQSDSDDLLQSNLEEPNSPIPDASTSEPAVESASMKEDDSNENQNQNSPDSDSEWSPFFEELEGEEFDIDNTIDLNAEDWQAEVPTPPSSPFSTPAEYTPGSDSSNTNADDLYFDVDADPDDTLFAPSGSLEVDDPTNDDLSWATAPLDDVTDFFEDDPSMSSSFNEEVDPISALSAEDEFFAPIANTTTPDDTMFAPEADPIYEEASTEADDTIFLAPDQAPDVTQPAMAAAGATAISEPAPDAPAEPPKSRNPYAYREKNKKSSSSSLPWIALVIAAVVLISGGVAYWQGLLPFGGANTPANPTPANSAVNTQPVPAPETTTPAEQNAGENPDDNAGTNTEANTEANSANVAANQGGTTTPTPDPVTETPPAPTAQRAPINISRGGWTVIVSSEEQRQEAERIADDFALKLGNANLPIDILTTDQFEVTRYRVGVGQFSTRNQAKSFMNRSGNNLPSKAWLLKID